MQKRIKNKLIKYLKLILSKRAYLVLMFLFFFLTTAFGILFVKEKKSASTITTPNIITKRFGECPTCDVKGVTQNATVYRVDHSDGGGPNTAFDPSSQTLFLSTKYGRFMGIIMKFDLTSLSGKKITKAKIKLSFPTNTTETAQPTGEIAPIIKLKNTTSDWTDSNGLSFNYKNTSAGIKWTNIGNGNIDTAYSVEKDSSGKYYDQIGGLYFKEFLTLQKNDKSEINASPTSYLDLTTVQNWVTNPSANQGFIILPTTSSIKYAASKNYNPTMLNGRGEQIAGLDNLRPYLEITYEDSQAAVLAEAPVQPTNVKANYYKGQTFITWDEVETGKEETVYRIYRSNSPITELTQATLIDQVNQGSSWIRETQLSDLPIQPDYSKAGVVLKPNSGLYVYSAKNKATEFEDAYYAVTTVVEGNENLYLNSNASSLVTEKIDYPDMFFGRGAFGINRPVGVMWLGDYNWNNPGDQYGFHNKKSAPYLFTLVFPDRALPKSYPEKGTELERLYLSHSNQAMTTSEQFPLTVMLHASTKSMYYSDHTTHCVDDNGGDNYGGFCLGIEDNWAEVLRVDNNYQKGSFAYEYTLNSTYGNAYYAGWNSNYIQRKGIMTGGINGAEMNFGCITKHYENPSADLCIRFSKRPDNLEVERPYEEGRSIMYSEKSITFIMDTLFKRSPWKNNFDVNRVYAGGGSLGAGGSLALAMHNPKFFTAVDLLQGRVKITEEDLHGANPDYWGSPTSNIKTQDGVGGASGIGIWDYMDIGKYANINKSLDFPIIRNNQGKLDSTIQWTRNFNFYQDALSAKLGFSSVFSSVEHNYYFKDVTPISFPDYVPLVIEGDGAAVKQTLPFWNVFHYKTNQSYPAFTNFTHNDNLGDGNPAVGDPIGGINRFQVWDPGTISDQADKYTINLSMIDLSSYVSAILPHGDVAAIEHSDVTLRRLQNLIHTPGRSYSWKNIVVSTGQLVEANQSGTVTADSDGLITIPQVALTKAGTQLVLDLLPATSIPSITPISDVHAYPNLSESVNPIVANGSTYLWEKVFGPGNVTFTPSNTNATTSISADQTGTYSIIFNASNNNGSSNDAFNLIVHKLADINGDNNINFTDFSMLLSSWGSLKIPLANMSRTGASLNTVDFQDFSTLLSRWGG